MGSLDAQVMLVTRASRGIGEYVALHLARAGAKVTVAARTEEVTDPRLLSTIHSVAQAIAEEGGHIINVSSGQARLPGRGPYPAGGRGNVFYGMVKAGLERFSQGLAMDLQGDNISVNVLSPGGRIRTPGNVWAEQDPAHPNLDFEPSDDMGKAAVWMWDQPPQEYTGNIETAVALCERLAL